jgi:hypothetical protein
VESLRKKKKIDMGSVGVFSRTQNKMMLSALYWTMKLSQNVRHHSYSDMVQYPERVENSAALL